MKTTRRWGIAAGVILASVAVLYLLLYMYERPGGWSDQRMSHSLGLKQTLQIPLGASPEEAVELFRHSDSMTVIHQEPVARGKLVFLARAGRQEGSDLQVEYVRKTWLGWKWVWGAGYGMSKDPSASAINYMRVPELEQISTPFPMLFGEVLDPSIQHIVVQQKEAGIDKSEAKLIQAGPDRTIWLAFQPATAGVPFEIEGLDENREIIVSKVITDIRDSGSIDSTRRMQ
ncbi:hypothetical protein HQN87_11885 [Paenibacillus tritici]|uniref:Uncharacterized protein n=1 Tax=Paenibacillus tritici TaxID=1873425 RepID=A0ABX2DN49_9BACL|nr:hypothetical protein [Paenibacillus tritici]NQX46032.1 hypothetical protein [Paenibacillus tritici]